MLKKIVFYQRGSEFFISNLMLGNINFKLDYYIMKRVSGYYINVKYEISNFV